MPDIGWQELLIVLIVALVIFGPKRLPDLGHSLGKGIREFRKGVSGIQEHLDGEDEDTPAKQVTEASVSEVKPDAGVVGDAAVRQEREQTQNRATA